MLICTRRRRTATDKKTPVEIKNIKYLCGFKSRVANPEEVDWRIAMVGQYLDLS